MNLHLFVSSHSKATVGCTMHIVFLSLYVKRHHSNFTTRTYSIIFASNHMKIRWSSCVSVEQSGLFWSVTVKLWKQSSSFLLDMMLTFCSVSLPLSPLGNDLEALQIHLCFCHSNLHPRRTARSGSTLVSTVSNIYLSQQIGEKPGSCWSFRQADGAIRWPLAHCLQSPALWRGFETDWICLLFASHCSYQPVHEKIWSHILWFQHLLTCFSFVVIIISHFLFALLTNVSFSLGSFFIIVFSF